jgi:hypothetical protein
MENNQKPALHIKDCAAQLLLPSKRVLPKAKMARQNRPKKDRATTMLSTIREKTDKKTNRSSQQHSDPVNARSEQIFNKKGAFPSADPSGRTFLSSKIKLLII